MPVNRASRGPPSTCGKHLFRRRSFCAHQPRTRRSCSGAAGKAPATSTRPRGTFRAIRRKHAQPPDRGPHQRRRLGEGARRGGVGLLRRRPPARSSRHDLPARLAMPLRAPHRPPHTHRSAARARTGPLTRLAAGAAVHRVERVVVGALELAGRAVGAADGAPRDAGDLAGRSRLARDAPAGAQGDRAARLLAAVSAARITTAAAAARMCAASEGAASAAGLRRHVAAAVRGTGAGRTGAGRWARRHPAAADHADDEQEDQSDGWLPHEEEVPRPRRDKATRAR